MTSPRQGDIMCGKIFWVQMLNKSQGQNVRLNRSASLAHFKIKVTENAGNTDLLSMSVFERLKTGYLPDWIQVSVAIKEPYRHQTGPLTDSTQIPPFFALRTIQPVVLLVTRYCGTMMDFYQHGFIGNMMFPPVESQGKILIWILVLGHATSLL